MPEKLNFEEGDPMLISNFWDCECKRNFIHRKSTTPACDICHCSHDEQPDSRAHEVLLSASHLLSAEECKEIADKIGSQKKETDGLFLYYESSPTYIFITEQVDKLFQGVPAHVVKKIVDTILYDPDVCSGEEDVLWSIRSTKNGAVYVFAYLEDEENEDNTKQVVYERYFDSSGIENVEALLTSTSMSVPGYGWSIVLTLDGEQI